MTAPAPAILASSYYCSRIRAAFKHGADTMQIAKALGLSEAQVYNALHKMREQARAA